MIVEYLIRFAALYLAAFLANIGEEKGGFRGKLMKASGLALLITAFSAPYTTGF